MKRSRSTLISPVTTIQEEQEETPTIPHYFIDNGFRKVKPYYFNYKTHAKGRWIGKTILNMFQSEFVDRPQSYYKSAIDHGKVTVNSVKVNCDYVIKHSDRISHSIHRHEPPISSTEIQVLALSKEYLIVNKPASIPVHPTGRYHHNTVTNLLKHYWTPWVFNQTPAISDQLSVSRAPLPLHRIDRLTSGIQIFCLLSDRASELAAQFTSNVVGKQYICRVIGEFPDGDEIMVDKPIKILHYKLGLNHIHADGKPSVTYFKRLAYNGTESLVLARPITGRTHQIRLHLRHLGHPITNDPLYNNPSHKHLVNDQKAWESAVDVTATCAFKDLPHTDTSENHTQKSGLDVNGSKDDPDHATREWVNAVTNAKQLLDLRVIGQCSECTTDLLADPEPEDMSIYLHAFQYTLNGNLGLSNSHFIQFDPSSQQTTIQTPLPDWAEGWDRFSLEQFKLLSSVAKH